MGTNYFWQTTNEHGYAQALHIGKSSAGWCFSLHVHPHESINGLNDWMRKFAEGGRIYDEYGQPVSVPEMARIITERRAADGSDNWQNRFGGREAEASYHRQNISERGPDGLLRHRVDGIYCIGHGEGTYDLMIGEFS